MNETQRPRLKARQWTWKDRDGSQTPGVGIIGRRGLVGHLTPTEARTLADRIHDLLDADGNPEQPLPTTEAERE